MHIAIYLIDTVLAVDGKIESDCHEMLHQFQIGCT
jgi:hypothetical protein